MSGRRRRACGPSFVFFAQERNADASKSVRSAIGMANLLRSPCESDKTDRKTPPSQAFKVLV